MLQKLLLFTSLTYQQPTEAWDRINGLFAVRYDRYSRRAPSYEAQNFVSATAQLLREMGWDLARYAQEPSCLEIDNYVQQETQKFHSNAPFLETHNADILLAKTCYAMCRVLRPAVVVETGVAYGVNSAFILQALAVNQYGCLWSIDLPPLTESADTYVGSVIPSSLKDRWHLIRGASRRELPRLVQELSAIDIFIHDSLHTYANIHFEFDAVEPRLSRPGVMIADDIEGNMAFDDWALAHPEWSRLVISQQDKPGLYGILIQR